MDSNSYPTGRNTLMKNRLVLAIKAGLIWTFGFNLSFSVLIKFAICIALS